MKKEDLEKAKILHEFGSKLMELSEDLDPRFAKIMDENFWDLVDKGGDQNDVF